MSEQPTKMWSGRFREPLNPTFEQWQRSFPSDVRLLPQEVAASKAHARTIAAATLTVTFATLGIMRITVQLPDDLAQHTNPAREALEAFAIEGYRSGALSAYQTRLMLGFETRYELDGFLKAHEVWEHAYSVDDLEQDAAGFNGTPGATHLASEM